jgi:hypothetical protein
MSWATPTQQVTYHYLKDPDLASDVQLVAGFAPMAADCPDDSWRGSSPVRGQNFHLAGHGPTPGETRNQL